MSMKKKKWAVFGSVLCCLALSLFLSVIQFSSTNIENIVEERETVSLHAENEWKEAEQQTAVSFDEAQSEVTVSCEEPIYVENVLIGGEVDGELLALFRQSASWEEEKTEETK